MASKVSMAISNAMILKFVAIYCDRCSGNHPPTMKIRHRKNGNEAL
jgi:hypothetical protein